LDRRSETGLRLGTGTENKEYNVRPMPQPLKFTEILKLF